MQLALKTLRQPEVNQQGAGVFQIHQVGPVFHIVAHIHQPYAQRAVKGCQQRHAAQPGLRQGHLGLRHLQVGGAFVQYPLGDKIFGHQFLVAPVVGLRNRQLRLGLAQLGPLQCVVQLHQYLAPFDACTINKTQPLDAPRHFGPQHHALARTQGAHGLCIVLQTHRQHLGYLHPGNTGRGCLAGRGGAGLRACAHFLRHPGARLQPPGCARCGGNAHCGQYDEKGSGCHEVGVGRSGAPAHAWGQAPM